MQHTKEQEGSQLRAARRKGVVEHDWHPGATSFGAGVLARVQSPKITDASPGETAILNAYFGGAGHEFITLIQREVHNLFGVVGGIRSGAILEYSVPGVVVKTPNLQPGYTGLPHDALALTVGGAVVLKGKKIELGAIVPRAVHDHTVRDLDRLRGQSWGGRAARSVFRESAGNHARCARDCNRRAFRPVEFRNDNRSHHRSNART